MQPLAVAPNSSKERQQRSLGAFHGQSSARLPFTTTGASGRLRPESHRASYRLNGQGTEGLPLSGLAAVPVREFV